MGQLQNLWRNFLMNHGMHGSAKKQTKTFSCVSCISWYCIDLFC